MMRAELVGEAGRFERELPVVLVDVELAALRAGLRPRLRLVDRGGDAVDVEDAGEGEAAEAGADDRDRGVIVLPFEDVWNVVPVIIIGTMFQPVKMGSWRPATQRAERRTDALSKERIVEAAIEILDAEGESALTFRALAARLATGTGAIYWHVANKDELLAAATDDVIARAMTEVVAAAEPQEAIRAIALGVFDAIDAHPWVGAQLSREPWQPAMLQIFEGIGAQLQALGVPERAQFDCGVRARELHPRPRRPVRRGRPPAPPRHRPSGRSSRRRRPVGAARPRRVSVRAPRSPRSCPSTTTATQFLAGIDLILAGINAVRSASAGEHVGGG